MLCIVFIFGRPGSGKSIATRHIQQCLENEKFKKWSVTRIKDYDILYDMFEQDRKIEDEFKRRFRDAVVKDYDVRGFDVVDFAVLDEALEKTVQKIGFYLKEASSSIEEDLVVVEFARNNYKDVFEKLASYLDKELEPNKGRDLLQQSFFLFVEADLEDCRQRIHERVKSPIREDNHFISDNILFDYYENDGADYIKDDLKKDYNIDQRHIRTIENNSSQSVFLVQVASFLEVIKQEEVKRKEDHL